MDLKLGLNSILNEYSPGQKIPGERSLAEKFGVARMTLRVEIENLILQGKLQRKPGSGTYIANQCYSLPARCRSFSAEMLSRGLAPRNQLLSVKTISADKIVSSMLRIPSNSKILKFSRLRFGGDIPMAYQSTCIPVSYIGHIEDYELESSLEDILQQKFSISITTSHTEIASEFADQKIANLLKISPNKPCLLKETIDIDQNGRNIMWTKSWYNAETFRIKFDASCSVHDGRNQVNAPLDFNSAKSAMRSKNLA